LLGSLDNIIGRIMVVCHLEQASSEKRIKIADTKGLKEYVNAS